MTRFRSLTAVLLAATALAAGPALAQDAAGPAGKPDRTARRHAAFNRLDSNKDGFIDRDESHARREAIFARLDVNKDGRLTPDEYPASRRRRAPAATTRDGSVNTQTGTTTPPSQTAQARASRMFQRLDTNKDGTISRDEWLAADDARFNRCDVDKDGKLAFDECRMAQAGRSRRTTTVQ